MELEPGEKIVVEVRRHWLVFALQSILLFVLILAPLLEIVVPEMLRAVGVELILGPSAWFIAATWWLLIWMTFFIAWTSYYLDMWTVTDRRIISVEQEGLFNRQVSECRLDRIQDVTVEVRGFLPTFLHYGTIMVQTAAEAERFKMDHVPNCYAVKDSVFAAIRAAHPDHPQA